MAQDTESSAQSSPNSSTIITGPTSPHYATSSDGTLPAEPPTEITEDTDLTTLSAAQVYELNQNLLDLTADVQRPLVASVAPIAELRAEYENGSHSFVQQIDYLQSQGYSSIRRTRGSLSISTFRIDIISKILFMKGDGDCFYRSVAFAYVEKLIDAPEPAIAVAEALSILEATPKLLESVGFENMVFEDFYEMLDELVRSVVSPDAAGNTLNEETLLKIFQNFETSNSIVVYLRMLTSAQIRLDPETFAPFLFHPELGEPMGVREFCEHFVDATGKEAGMFKVCSSCISHGLPFCGSIDHVQMTALSKILRLNVDVAYLDGRGSNGQVEFVKFQPEETSEAATSSPICLLYRPGHYDILVGPRR
ncbi:peptidase C65 Otubain-domain-containing protein [Lentinula aciculospora]|uniref:ubiquitinyl hydrolase 1 n=1 Tax=Lentinula aciculospora TaxID=153920 RepID=A0A9W9AER6_9AGAR|nr:peptidase C65 Otubain-domain-containing protein [Lentinula aciculospora]